ncbi:Hsp33 family molecular chaperone HslO [Massilia arenosa]|uniref:Hsp33 family molecular chaperone HslO n=1 Tax=Zemynaea arenosa TaxID=2561931 RepID=A0A4Y9SXG5_9BURK|nr:Hsp33 family molecular chaperone HslO [Massilia arenosa]TFW30039.1 Hsp33 family molecular chaperone HslO [Massilia arenosa]
MTDHNTDTIDTTGSADTLQKFIFENAAVRGEFVEISDTWAEIQARHTYPLAVKHVLGEMVAAAALLSANLKFNGSIVMQLHGDGPVKLMVVECDADLRMRATAKLSAHADIADDTPLQQLVNVHRQGRFVITLDPLDKVPGQQPYQGIVPLDGEDMAVVIENYMLRSEQMDTKLWLAADDNVARGLLLQKLPRHTGKEGEQPKQATVEEDLETWNRAVSLASTLKQEELLAAGIETLMHRLFWEETLRVFEPLHPSFHCTCTREKVANMLKMLGREEVESALEDLGTLSINCDFCGKHYGFDAVDCAQVFAQDAAVQTLHHPEGGLKH